jgi:hypothetical protein
LLPPSVFGQARGFDFVSLCDATGDHLINIGVCAEKMMGRVAARNPDFMLIARTKSQSP